MRLRGLIMFLFLRPLVSTMQKMNKICGRKPYKKQRQKVHGIRDHV